MERQKLNRALLKTWSNLHFTLGATQKGEGKALDSSHVPQFEPLDILFLPLGFHLLHGYHLKGVWVDSLSLFLRVGGPLSASLFLTVLYPHVCRLLVYITTYQRRRCE
jgi:hypothetical protein